ncbi:hypothetical protein ElyMa_002206700 [Elysia marginata]|uniref:Uncharacterized protein n=1 Tax=Elysia marginata TaxID=1093978 RepID=A0AAV4FTM7_9GAST|nr:hypothetical protein ElyMa_002206700 [Elysia marginata]
MRSTERRKAATESNRRAYRIKVRKIKDKPKEEKKQSETHQRTSISKQSLFFQIANVRPHKKLVYCTKRKKVPLGMPCLTRRDDGKLTGKPGGRLVAPTVLDALRCL